MGGGGGGGGGNPKGNPPRGGCGPGAGQGAPPGMEAPKSHGIPFAGDGSSTDGFMLGAGGGFVPGGPHHPFAPDSGGFIPPGGGTGGIIDPSVR